MDKCTWGDGITIKPDGENELDPCVYEEIEVIPHCTVHVWKCIKCGHIEIMWKREEEEQDDAAD